MLNKIQNCYDEELLHQMGLDIDMSLAPCEIKEPLFIAIEAQLKSLSLLMAESSEITNSDADFRYED